MQILGQIRMQINTIAYTSLALFAFAGNSVLCRLALGENSIDAASFTVIRLLSGVLALALIIGITRSNKKSAAKGSWTASFMLFIYALTFSYAYISLDTGTGALILFGSVQITMILRSIFTGGRLHYSEWIGMSVAFCGFVYLVLPGLGTPSVDGFFLMTIAGIAWGIYTLKGQGSTQALNDTAYNFLRTVPFVIVVFIITLQDINLSQQGVILAVASGALTSGFGYTVWYLALPGLSTTQAAVVQLLVPVIAAVGGIVFANETASLRLIVSSILILGGIFLVVLGHNYFLQNQERSS